MAAEAQRAPRVAAHAMSMAALAAAPSITETPLANAWLSVWNGCGGVLLVAADSKRCCSFPLGDDGKIDPPYAYWSEEERRGALKALVVIIQLGGESVAASVFGTIS